MVPPPEAVYVLRLPVDDEGTGVGEGPGVDDGLGVGDGPGPGVNVRVGDGTAVDVGGVVGFLYKTTNPV